MAQRTRRAAIVVALVAAAACAALPPPAAVDVHEEIPTEMELAAPLGAALAPIDGAAPAPADAAVDVAADAPARASGEPPEQAYESLRDWIAWLKVHGVASVDDKLASWLTSMACHQVRAGAPARDAILCTDGPPMEGSIPWGESLFPLMIVVPDHGVARVALRVPIAAGPMTRERTVREDDPDHGLTLQLLFDLAPDGAHLTLRERPERTCAATLRELRRKNEQPGEKNGVLAPHIQVVEAACRSRGSYVWSQKGFARTVP